MKRFIFYLLPFLLLAACSKREEKVLYPTKVIVGNTQYDFLYNPNMNNRIYSITVSQPNFHEVFTYEYYDESSENPNHKWKNKISNFDYEPDRNVTGWDDRDSVIHKSTLLYRRNDLHVLKESQFTRFYKKATSVIDTRNDRLGTNEYDVRHTYNADNQLTESAYFLLTSTIDKVDTLGVLAKRVKYTYNQDKLAKVAFYAPDTDKPYLVIELRYDDNPGYMRNLPLEARFLPLELPYRDHNIVSYKVTDGQGNIRKDLSYTCTYSYNRNGYPNTFTRKMLDGRKVKGHMVYRTESKSSAGIAAAN